MIIALLTVGIGGVTALFGPLHTVAVAPLPFPASDQLVRAGGGIPLFNVYTNTLDRREQLASIFSSVAAYAPAVGYDGEARLSPSSRPIFISAKAATPEFFHVVGATPLFGNGLASGEGRRDVVIISYRFWQGAFDRSNDIVGRVVRIGQQNRTIIGVMPEGFDFPRGADAWLPMSSASYQTGELEVIGRLRPGVTLEQATAVVSGIGKVRSPGQFAADGPTLQSLREYLNRKTRATVWMIWTVSGVFLLATCVGATNLLITEGLRRRPEMLIRLALGSSRARLVRQLLAETLLVVLVGAVLGTLFASLTSRWLEVEFPILPAGQMGLVSRLALACAITVLVTLVCGLLMAFHTTRVSITEALSGASGRGTVPHKKGRYLAPRDYLAAAQLATALTLLIAVSVMANSLGDAINTPLGFMPTNAVTFQSRLPPSPAIAAAIDGFEAASPESKADLSLRQRTAAALQPALQAMMDRNILFFRNALDEIGALPDVASVGLLTPAPFTVDATEGLRMMTFASAADGNGSKNVRTTRAWVSPGGFQTLGISLISGRAFTEGESSQAAALKRVARSPSEQNQAASSRAIGSVIINDILARQLWPDQDPVGKNLRDAFEPSALFTVVGVASSYRWTSDPAPAPAAAYYPFVGERSFGNFVIRFRDQRQIREASSAIANVVDRLMPGLPPTEIQDFQALTREPQRLMRTVLNLVGSFSLLATVVAALGVYASNALMSDSRMRDMGIRKALGADAWQIRRWAFLQAIRPLLLGLPVGLFGAWVLTRQLANVMPGISAPDPSNYGLGVGLLVATTFMASLPFSIAAGSVDAAAALRSE